jgi:hypothetical protein
MMLSAMGGGRQTRTLPAAKSMYYKTWECLAGTKPHSPPSYGIYLADEFHLLEGVWQQSASCLEPYGFYPSSGSGMTASVV